MPFDLADLFNKRRLITVDNDGATLEIYYAPARFDAKMMIWVDQFTASARTAENAPKLPDLAKAAQVLEYLIVDWNAVESGVPVPIEADNLLRFEVGFLIEMLNSIQADYYASKNVNSSSSTSKAMGVSGKRRNGTAT